MVYARRSRLPLNGRERCACNHIRQTLGVIIPEESVVIRDVRKILPSRLDGCKLSSDKNNQIFGVTTETTCTATENFVFNVFHRPDLHLKKKSPRIYDETTGRYLPTSIQSVGDHRRHPTD